MKPIENRFDYILKKDKLPFETNPAIQQRLNYYLQLRNASSKVKQNSIFSFLGGLFTIKLVGIKISLVSFAFIAIFGYKQFNSPAISSPISDTSITTRPLDTSIMLLFSGDSIFTHIKPM